MPTYLDRLKFPTTDLLPMSQERVKCLSVNAKKPGCLAPIIASVVNKTGRWMMQCLFGIYRLAHHF